MLKERSNAMEEEKSALMLQISNEKYALETKNVDLMRRENALSEGEKLLSKKQTDFEISIKTMEPQLNAIKYEVEQANNSKRDAEAYWQKVRAQADDVLIAENEILAKERDMFSLADQVSRKREELNVLKRKIQDDIQKQNTTLRLLTGDRFTIYECAMAISSEISQARQTIVKNEDRIMRASEGSAAEGFMLQDSLRNLDRSCTRLNQVIKSLADTKVVKDSTEIDESLSSSSIKSILNLDEIPKIDIENPTSKPSVQESASIFNFLLTNSTSTSNAVGQAAKDVASIKSNSNFLTSYDSSRGMPSTDVTLSIESASQSLLDLKDLSTKFGITV